MIEPYIPLTGAAERALDFTQGPHLLSFAARSLTRIYIELHEQHQTAVVEEGVNVNINCLPGQSSLQNLTAQWFFRSRNINGELIGGELNISFSSYHLHRTIQLNIMQYCTVPSLPSLKFSYTNDIWRVDSIQKNRAIKTHGLRNTLFWLKFVRCYNVIKFTSHY